MDQTQVSPAELNVALRESSWAREAVRCEAGGAVLGRLGTAGPAWPFSGCFRM